jgi:hypothetical protein
LIIELRRKIDIGVWVEGRGGSVLARQGGNDVVVHGVDNNYIDRGGCKVVAAKCRQSIRAQRVTLDSPLSKSYSAMDACASNARDRHGRRQRQPELEKSI